MKKKVSSKYQNDYSIIRNIPEQVSNIFAMFYFGQQSTHQLYIHPMYILATPRCQMSGGAYSVGEQYGKRKRCPP